ncbi:MAG: hypothetical protein IMY83_01715, partial [Chloroflexi bacterium]|nr:hypothetical protein [Chloroflexota bacterium]
MSIQELLDYVAILRKRWWLILLLVISTVGTILVISRSQKPLYEASLKFLFTTPPISEVSVYNEFRQVSVGQEIPAAKANFIEMLTSKVVIWDAIETLGADLTGDEVLARLTVEQSPVSGFVELSLQCEDPQLAADMTNALMDTALRYYGELRAKPTTMSRIFISEQLSLSREGWEKAEEKITQFQIEHNIGDLETEIDRQQSLIQSLTLVHDTDSAEGNMEAVARYETIMAQRKQELQNLLALRPRYTTLKTASDQVRGTHELLLARQTQAELKENEIMSVGFINVLG